MGLSLVGLLFVWLAINLDRTPSLFFEATLIGITNGCIYALVALGYSLVYGILELINFAHGDVFMLGAMFAITLASAVGLRDGAADLWPLVIVCLIFAMACCAVINAAIEFIAYRPLRHAPRLAPLITAIGMSFIIEDVGLIWKGPDYVNFPTVLPNSNLFSIGSVGVRWDDADRRPAHACRCWSGSSTSCSATKQGKAMRATAQDRSASAIMGDQRQPDDLVHLPDRRRARRRRRPRLRASPRRTVRYDTGFTLGLIAFTSAVLGGIGNLPGAVLGALLIGLIQAFNEALNWHAPGSDWTESIVFTILILILVFRPEGLLGERTPEGG